MAQLNVSEFLSARALAAGNDLARACEKMPSDRIGWHPVTEGNRGRDSLDQALECAYLNEWAATVFRNGAANGATGPAFTAVAGGPGAPVFDSVEYKSKQDANRTPEAALPWLHHATTALAEAIRAFPADRFGDKLTNPIINRAQTWAEFADFFYWNTVYHEGQVNYIQVLYGDLS